MDDGKAMKRTRILNSLSFATFVPFMPSSSRSPKQPKSTTLKGARGEEVEQQQPKTTKIRRVALTLVVALFAFQHLCIFASVKRKTIEKSTMVCTKMKSLSDKHTIVDDGKSFMACLVLEWYPLR
jgi:hypothetical protein